jgi:hypothetical protein
MAGRIRVLIVAALLVAGACDDGRTSAQPPSSTTLASAGIDTEVPTALPETQPPETQPPSTQAQATTSTTEDEGPPVVLRGDGLGAHRFGDPVDEVIAGLTLRWAPPNQDSGWTPAGNSPFGVCPGNEVRVVEWRGFSVLFSDGPTPFGPAGRRHFFSWNYQAEDLDHPAPDPGGNRPRLATPAGISVGATVDDLQRAYGDKLELFDEEEGPGPSFGVQTADGGLFGTLTSAEPGGIVRYIVGGGGCGE